MIEIIVIFTGVLSGLKKKLANTKAKLEKMKEEEYRPMPDEIERRRQERELRKDDVKEFTEKNSEIEEMKKRWAAQDALRAKHDAEDLAYDREKKWARQVATNEAIRRDRERYREERAARVEENATRKNVRENKWNYDQAKEPLDKDNWQESIVSKKKEMDRALSRATDPLPRGRDEDDPYTYLAFLETKTKTDARAHRRRIKEAEVQNEEMRRWYVERNLERTDAQIRQNRIIFSK